eukprot:793227_1
MGTSCSQVSCITTCNCFIHDKHIKNIWVARNTKVRWIWTNEHESTLVTILTDPEYDYNVPLVVIDIIKNLSYSQKHPYYVRKPHLCQEAYYSKQNKLLNKKLCTSWYHSKLSNFSPFPIVIFSSDAVKSDCNVQPINGINQYLQDLQPRQNHNSNVGCSKRCTLFIDHCPIQIDVFPKKNIENNNYYVYFNKPIYLILVNENDSKARIDNICCSIWNENNSMNSCILVRVNQISS